jgi:septal ring-binding cell division protein DamX
MKREMGTALVALLILAGGPALAAEPADKAEVEKTAAAEVRTLNRERAEQAQAEAAEDAAEAVRSATKLDLDIRLIGPTSVADEI